jgi:hypothetical protein
VIDEGEVTVRTFDDMTADAADLHPIKTAAIEKQECLFPALTTFFNPFDELWRKMGKPPVVFIGAL